MPEDESTLHSRAINFLMGRLHGVTYHSRAAVFSRRQKKPTTVSTKDFISGPSQGEEIAQNQGTKSNIFAFFNGRLPDIVVYGTEEEAEILQGKNIKSIHEVEAIHFSKERIADYSLMKPRKTLWIALPSVFVAFDNVRVIYEDVGGTFKEYKSKETKKHIVALASQEIEMLNAIARHVSVREAAKTLGVESSTLYVFLDRLRDRIRAARLLTNQILAYRKKGNKMQKLLTPNEEYEEDETDDL